MRSEDDEDAVKLGPKLFHLFWFVLEAIFLLSLIFDFDCQVKPFASFIISNVTSTLILRGAFTDLAFIVCFSFFGIGVCIDPGFPAWVLACYFLNQISQFVFKATKFR